MAKLRLASAMALFGTIGLFVRSVPLPASVLAMARGLIGTAFLVLAAILGRRRWDWGTIRKNLLLLVLSGAAIGFNWILLFASYRYTTVAVATLCYYLAPVFVILLSPLVLRERLTAGKLGCVAAALVGMALVSGVSGDTGGGGQFTGILLATGAAALYASVMLMNKFLKGLDPGDSTTFQLGAAALVLLPYVLLTEDLGRIALSPTALGLTLVVGVVHTGLAYRLYFSALPQLDGQTLALYSYIDPALAVVLSALVLGEPLGFSGVLGAALILGSTLAGELLGRKEPTVIYTKE